MTNLELQKTANEVRKDIVTAVHSAKSGHPGGSLSAADMFTYGSNMRGSAEYRRHLAEVLIRRSIRAILAEEQ